MIHLDVNVKVDLGLETEYGVLSILAHNLILMKEKLQFMGSIVSRRDLVER